MLIKGQNLTSRQKSIVLNAFIYRNTIENHSRPDGIRQEPVTDEQWIQEHAFHFIKDGSRLMANIHFCEPHYMADEA